MRIGLDFDNTIVCYDELFHQVALEEAAITSDIPVQKQAIRDHLRAIGNEDEWTRIQGLVYGERILEARLFSGFRAAIQELMISGCEIFIVSHKTLYPYAGVRHDLHRAAFQFLEHHRIVSEDGGFIDRESVFLEPTKEAKAERIAALDCDVFVDDLPEFLAEVHAPATVHRVLFNPKGAKDEMFQVLENWADFPGLVGELSPQRSVS